MQPLALVVVLAAQTPAARTPYLDAVAGYGPGTERQAVATLLALRLRDVDRVFEELDRVCAAQGARTCMPRDLERVGPDVRDRVAGTWRQLYPRVMAVHAEALVAAGTRLDGAGVALHSGVLLRLAARCDDIARGADARATIAGLATTGRRLVLWALQYLRAERGLGDTLDILDSGEGPGRRGVARARRADRAADGSRRHRGGRA